MLLAVEFEEVSGTNTSVEFCPATSEEVVLLSWGCCAADSGEVWLLPLNVLLVEFDADPVLVAFDEEVEFAWFVLLLFVRSLPVDCSSGLPLSDAEGEVELPSDPELEDDVTFWDSGGGPPLEVEVELPSVEDDVEF